MSRLTGFLKALLSGIDVYLLLAALLILVFGVAEVWSTNSALVGKQIQLAAVGLVLFLVAWLIDYRRLRLASPLVLAGSIVILGGTILAGFLIRGVSRWMRLGPFVFQPSEFAKLGFILGLAWLLSEGRLSIRRRFLLSLPILAISCGLVVLQPDLGTALVFVAIWAGMIFMANLPLTYLFSLLALAIASLPVVWHFLKDYQRERIYSFLNPQADPLGSGYNVLQSIIAIGSGQLLGKGLGRGTQSQLHFLPERSTDFIFAALAEEWGLLGVAILLGLYFVLLGRVLTIARHASSDFGMLLVMGVFLMLLAQIFINVGMNLGLMPVAGLPLPLVSAGGSSLIVTLISLGLVGSVARHREP